MQLNFPIKFSPSHLFTRNIALKHLARESWAAIIVRWWLHSHNETNQSEIHGIINSGWGSIQTYGQQILIQWTLGHWSSGQWETRHLANKWRVGHLANQYFNKNPNHDIIFIDCFFFYNYIYHINAVYTIIIIIISTQVYYTKLTWYFLCDMPSTICLAIQTQCKWRCWKDQLVCKS